MNKATFKYKKSDNTVSERVLLRPQMLKEATNTLKDFSNPNVNYIHGLEIDKSTLTSTDVIKYEKAIENYYTAVMMTLEQYLTSTGLDASKVQYKSFKKDGVSDLNIV